MINESSEKASGYAIAMRREGLYKVCGIIKNYSKKREEGIFVFDKNNRSAMEAIAISAALVGFGSQAIAVSISSNSMEEHADYIEFEIDEKKMKGWLWRSPFFEGDHVNIAAEWQVDHYEVFGISRPGDRMIALYPHCSRSRNRHLLNALKWWLIISLATFLAVIVQDCVFMGIPEGLHYWYVRSQKITTAYWVTGVFVVLAVPVISIARQWMTFVKVADKVFRTLELPGAANLDLVKTSKKQRTAKDKGEFGSMYFRY